MDTALTGKVALVTGASTGIGLAIAQRYCTAGAQVILVSRNAEKLQSALSQIEGKAVSFVCDISKLAELDKLYQYVQQDFGRIDILVANAGIQYNLPLKEVTEENFDLVTNTNYKGVFFTVQRAIPLMRQGASIILISSIAAHNGYQANSVYAASKAAVSQLAKNFAADLVAEKIRVNAISPGCVKTPIWDKVLEDYPDIIEARGKALIPAGRFADAHEIAELALYLAGSDSNYVNGQDFIIDGGETGLSI